MPQSRKKERIVNLLSAYEPDYSRITAKLSEKDIPILNELVMQGPVDVAARAIICLGWLSSEKGIPAIEFAAKSDNPILRLTAAHSLGNLSNKPGAWDLICGLLDDNDIGVRKFALKSIGHSKIPHLKEKVVQVSLSDPNEHIRKLAEHVLEKLDAPNTPGSH